MFYNIVTFLRGTIAIHESCYEYHNLNTLYMGKF